MNSKYFLLPAYGCEQMKNILRRRIYSRCIGAPIAVGSYLLYSNTFKLFCFVISERSPWVRETSICWDCAKNTSSLWLCRPSSATVFMRTIHTHRNGRLEKRRLLKDCKNNRSRMATEISTCGIKNCVTLVIYKKK